MRWMQIIVVLMVLAGVALGQNVDLVTQPATQPAFASKPVEKDGLQVVVTLPKATLASNEALKFTVQFKNVSEKPLILQDAEYFWDWRITFEGQRKEGAWRLEGLFDADRKAQIMTLKPGEEIVVPVKLAQGNDKPRLPFQYVWEGNQKKSLRPIKILHPGRYQLVIEMTRKDGPQAYQLWNGTIKSEPVEFEITDKIAATQPAASRLRAIELVAGMKRLEAERLIAAATGVKSTYDLHAMNTDREVTYRDGSEALIVKYKPGLPAPTFKMPDGGHQTLPAVDGEVISWEFVPVGEAATHPATVPATRGGPTQPADADTQRAAEAETRDLAATQQATEPARGKTSSKGWEHYVWRERDRSMYALVPGTNRLKSAEEISSTAVKGLAEIKRQLSELEKGQWVSINGRRLLQKPPQDEADALTKYGADIGLQMR